VGDVYSPPRAIDTLFIPCELVIPAPFPGAYDERRGYVSISQKWRSLSLLNCDVRESSFDPHDAPCYDNEIALRAGFDPSDPLSMQRLMIVLAGLGVDWA
jgi:hypothetical protein